MTGADLRFCLSLDAVFLCPVGGKMPARHRTHCTPTAHLRPPTLVFSDTPKPPPQVETLSQMVWRALIQLQDRRLSPHNASPSGATPVVGWKRRGLELLRSRWKAEQDEAIQEATGWTQPPPPARTLSDPQNPLSNVETLSHRRLELSCPAKKHTLLSWQSFPRWREPCAAWKPSTWCSSDVGGKRRKRRPYKKPLVGRSLSSGPLLLAARSLGDPRTGHTVHRRCILRLQSWSSQIPKPLFPTSRPFTTVAWSSRIQLQDKCSRPYVA